MSLCREQDVEQATSGQAGGDGVADAAMNDADSKWFRSYTEKHVQRLEDGPDGFIRLHDSTMPTPSVTRRSKF